MKLAMFNSSCVSIKLDALAYPLLTRDIERQRDKGAVGPFVTLFVTCVVGLTPVRAWIVPPATCFDERVRLFRSPSSALV